MRAEISGVFEVLSISLPLPLPLPLLCRSSLPLSISPFSPLLPLPSPLSTPPPPSPPPSPSPSPCIFRVGRLKELIQQQTGLIPKYQELFYENLPYNPSQSVRASKLPSTTVSTNTACSDEMAMQSLLLE